MIRGTTILIAHLGYPTAAFKAPMIYNPYFEKHGIDAVVMPMGAKAEDFAEIFRAVFRLTNIRGALITRSAPTCYSNRSQPISNFSAFPRLHPTNCARSHALRDMQRAASIGDVS